MDATPTPKYAQERRHLLEEYQALAQAKASRPRGRGKAPARKR